MDILKSEFAKLVREKMTDALTAPESQVLCHYSYEITRLSDLHLQVKATPTVEAQKTWGGAPRYFNIKVSEMM